MGKIRVNYSEMNSILGLSLPRIDMEFLNGGSITVPNKQGAYVIASGCGSGKTTIIKDMIKNLSGEGILYSAATIEECNEMFTWCYNLCREEGTFKTFNMNDVILLHSGECPIEHYKEEFNNWKNIYKNTPELISHKRIVICTHHKLFNTNPMTFLRYEWNKINIDIEDLSPMERAVCEYNDKSTRNYPRQLILIDELPTCETFKFSIDPTITRSLGEVKSEVYYDPSEPDERFRWKSRMTYPKEYNKPRGFKRFNILYDQEVCGTKFDIINSSTTRDKDLLSLAKGLIYDNYNDLSNGKSTYTVKYNISDFVLDRKMDTRILLFDGTGDLTFVNSRRFKLLTFKNKYSSPINVERFHNNIERKQLKYPDTEKINYLIDMNVNELENIISKNKKTLIVTWKNFKSEDEDQKPNKYKVTSEFLNDDINLPDIYRNRLMLRGHICDFETIHYMSGLDKATNKFREYDAVVFLGKFRVPNYAVGEFNKDYRVETNVENYSLYQLIQAITRTRIRLHNGDQINIYFSDDWNDGVIDLVKNYLSNNCIENKNTRYSYYEVLSSLKPKWREEISLLMEYDEGLKDAILRKDGYILEMNIDELYRLSPRSNKQIRSYYPLIKYLKSLNIDLIIFSNSNNFKN